MTDEHAEAGRRGEPAPVVRRGDDVAYETVDAADGLAKGVLIDADDGAPHFALRRFTLDPGAEVPRHTNEVEHEQYVLAGEYVVGIGDEERVVSEGDSLLIPAGTVHWYRNEGDEPGAFLCAVPTGDDGIELVDGHGATDAGADGEGDTTAGNPDAAGTPTTGGSVGDDG